MNADKPLTSFLQKKKPLILDGAMGTELQRRGIAIGLPLWSANAFLMNPAAVLQIHMDYIAAGADIITTNTFRTTSRAFRMAGMPDESAAMTILAVDLAKKARATFPGRNVLIAGSIAPLEDCYRPDLVPDEETLRSEHAEHARRLVDAGADFLLLETMNTIREAETAARAALETGKEVVVSFVCDHDGNLFDGESLKDALSLIAPLGVTAFSVNCVSPRYIERAIDTMVQSSPRPFGAYANAGVPGDEQSDVLTPAYGPEEYALCARRWIEKGASFIGGCCGTQPEYIEHLVQR